MRCIGNVPFADDQKIKYLYSLASRNENQHNNILQPVLELQNQKYERLLLLASTVGSPDVLIKAINDAKSRNDELKRKHDSDLAGFLPNKKPNTNASSSNNDNEERYKQGIKFVEQFKEAKMEQGHKKIDWIGCLKEGAELGLLNYKNANAVADQFSKITKKQ